ncbi:conserved hypothetical protein [Agrobacterium tumefaciens str. Kerr 14]|uniref:Uncharacterized protein n=1 Tax=Agrobacterium tumefaciens str. Kerr 14 TaxID=1183424 RepID=A0A1S7P0P2_AGRTU|nr:conserved hypothetical protein [Agrobacterium tumefaciens str. Kerr 14]
MTGVGGPDIARPPENEKCRTGLISRAAFFARDMSELFTFPQTAVPIRKICRIGNYLACMARIKAGLPLFKSLYVIRLLAMASINRVQKIMSTLLFGLTFMASATAILELLDFFLVVS